jgi:hypothetical protein
MRSARGRGEAIMRNTRRVRVMLAGNIRACAHRLSCLPFMSL